jgi:hypothetical protein
MLWNSTPLTTEAASSALRCWKLCRRWVAGVCALKIVTASKKSIEKNGFIGDGVYSSVVGIGFLKVAERSQRRFGFAQRPLTSLGDLQE